MFDIDTSTEAMPVKMRVLDLFSGIGGFSLGLERTGGFESVAFCEFDGHARKVLNKHWPEVPIYEDVKDLSASRLAADGIAVDVVCGGFPCQDISLSGSGGGLNGARSVLWFEMLRIIGEVRPKWAIIENVSALRSRGLEEVLRGLASVGYDAEWHCIPASAVGAPHRRDRIWIVAYPRFAGPHASAQPGIHRGETGAGARNGEPERFRGALAPEPLANPHKPRLEIMLQREAAEQPAIERAHSWSVEPDVARMAYGIPSRVDRITRLGNAVVPQIPEAIGEAILDFQAIQCRALKCS